MQTAPHAVFLTSMTITFPFFLCSLKGPSSEACLLPRTTLPPAAALPRKASMKSAATGVQVPAKPPPTSPLRLPKDCHRSLGDLKARLKINYRSLTNSWTNACYCDLFPASLTLVFFPFLQVTRVLVARFLQRSKRNLAPSSEHAGSTGQGPKRRSGAEGASTNHFQLEQVCVSDFTCDI